MTPYLYQDFYTLMASNGFLPHITLPTRITDTTMFLEITFTQIQDIFSDDIIIEIADYLL